MRISEETMKETTAFETMLKIKFRKKISEDVLRIFINTFPDTLFPHSIFHTLPVDGGLNQPITLELL